MSLCARAGGGVVEGTRSLLYTREQHTTLGRRGNRFTGGGAARYFVRRGWEGQRKKRQASRSVKGPSSGSQGCFVIPSVASHVFSFGPTVLGVESS